MPEFRIYRNKMHGSRFKSFVVTVLETDCWFGIDEKSYNSKISLFVENRIKKYRKILLNYIEKNPSFLKSFAPIPNDENADKIINKMISASALSNTGPMSTVAGAFADFSVKTLKMNLILKNW